MSKLKTKFSRAIINAVSWKTDRKIIVFESDDWGGISMPDKKTYDNLLRKGIRVDTNPYLKFDNLASESDLEYLFEILDNFQDFKGNSIKITANTIVANPDFEKIRENNFEKYYYQKFTETLKSYAFHSKSFDLWENGIKSGLFEPQYHGREHLNPILWINQLKKGSNDHLKMAFDSNVFNIPKLSYPNEKWILNSAFYPNDKIENEAIKESIVSGTNIFSEIFGIMPQSFIATGYFWHSNIEGLLRERGINSIQGLPIQKQPDYRKNKIFKKFNYLGKKNKYNQIYLVRNAFFEPTLTPNADTVAECLARISNNFKNKTPSIVGMHRLNFIGSLDVRNRDRNLKKLNILFCKIFELWPDVEILSSSELTNTILNDVRK